MIPVNPKTSDALKRQLNKEGLNVIFLRGRTIGQWLCNNKPKGIPKRWKQKIYKVPCECGQFYIGETGIWFDERENQHKYAVKKCDISNSFAAQVTQLNGMILVLLMDTNTKKTEKSKNLCTSMLFPTVGIQLDNYLT